MTLKPSGPGLEEDFLVVCVSEVVVGGSEFIFRHLTLNLFNFEDLRGLRVFIIRLRLS